MKKPLLLSILAFGAVSASQAGIHVDIGIPLPHEIIFGAPRYVPAPVYVEPAPVCVEPRYYAPAPRVVIAPPTFDVQFGGGYYEGYRDYRGHGRYRDCYPRYYDYDSDCHPHRRGHEHGRRW